MLALGVWRATRCPNCGLDIEECTSPDNDGRYVASLPHRCHATTARLIRQKEYEETPQSEALLFSVEKR